MGNVSQEFGEAVQLTIFDQKMATALDLRNMKNLRVLLEQGANLNQTDGFGNTPLILAAIEGDFALVKFLLEKGAAIEKVNNGGNSALKLAVANRNTDVLYLLIDAGATIDTGEGAYTAAWADREGYPAIAEVLRDAVENRTRTAEEKAAAEAAAATAKKNAHYTAYKKVAQKHKIKLKA